MSDAQIKAITLLPLADQDRIERIRRGEFSEFPADDCTFVADATDRLLAILQKGPPYAVFRVASPATASPASVSTGGAELKFTTIPIIKPEQIGDRTKFTVTLGFATEEDAFNFSHWVQDCRRVSGGAASDTPAGTEAEKMRREAEFVIRLQRPVDAEAATVLSNYVLRLLSQRDAASRELADLQRFKDYVHKRLDDAGVPVDPDSPHKAEGCRVGGRLDCGFTELADLRRALEHYRNYCHECRGTGIARFQFTGELRPCGTCSVARTALAALPPASSVTTKPQPGGQ